MSEWSARVSDKNATMTRDLIAQMVRDADVSEARIKEVQAMEEKGFWLCEDGHECADPGKSEGTEESICPVCAKPAKFVSRATMTGQDKYESDKDRGDAEKLVAAKRQQIAETEKKLEEQVATGKYFRGQAASSRNLADSLRNL